MLSSGLTWHFFPRENRVLETRFPGGRHVGKMSHQTRKTEPQRLDFNKAKIESLRLEMLLNNIV